MAEGTERYFDLSLAEQAELLLGLAPVLGRRAEILEGHLVVPGVGASVQSAVPQADGVQGWHVAV